MTLKQKILDVIYAGDWVFIGEDESGAVGILEFPQIHKFYMGNEDIIVGAIIAEVQSSPTNVGDEK